MIKLVAVDMDGTFLNGKGGYDEERFKQIFARLKEKDIRFVVASGNQYYQLKSFFPEMDKDIAFVSENGALVFQQDELIKESHFDLELVQEMLEFLESEYPVANTILCGVKKAYIQKSVSEEFKVKARRYYHRLEEVEELPDFKEERYVKLAVGVPNERTTEITEKLSEEFDGRAVAVSSGHGSVDIIVPGAHKASALKFLADKWGISREDIVAFGDGDNDAEMLGFAGHSYAMENCSPLVKRTAKYHALSNDESGVLEVLETYLEE